MKAETPRNSRELLLDRGGQSEVEFVGITASQDTNGECYFKGSACWWNRRVRCAQRGVSYFAV